MFSVSDAIRKANSGNHRTGIIKNLKMKKLSIVFSSLMTASILFVGCGNNSMEKDAKRLARMYCENQHLLQEIVNGNESALERSENLVKESKALSEELMEKYKTEEENRKFTEMVMKEAEKCE